MTGEHAITSLIEESLLGKDAETSDDTTAATRQQMRNPTTIR
jgi:hypothetical protein